MTENRLNVLPSEFAATLTKPKTLCARRNMKRKLLTNITPGEIIEEEFLKPMGLTQYRLAKP